MENGGEMPHSPMQEVDTLLMYNGLSKGGSDGETQRNLQAKEYLILDNVNKEIRGTANSWFRSVRDRNQADKRDNPEYSIDSSFIM
ncbi:hypothetical protein RRG08_061937, partial [Elysia crispata]